MRYPDYIPEPDADAALWMDALARALVENPTAYALAPSTAATVRQVVDEFLAALAVVSLPESRTSATLTAKVEARMNAQNLCRTVAQQIKLNDGISNAAKTAIGIRPINIARQRIAPPSTSPAVNVIAATPGVHTLVYHDSLTPNRKAKPFGAASLQLYKFVGPREGAQQHAPGDEDAPAPSIDIEAHARCVGMVTKTPFTVQHGPGERGRRITYWGRWVSRRGETGPWSNAASMIAA